MTSSIMAAAIGFWGWVGIFVVSAFVFIGVGAFVFMLRYYRKVNQGSAIVRNGMGGTNVSFSGDWVIPILHKAELMDISVKRIEIDRSGDCLLYTSPSPRDGLLSRMPSSA